MIDICCKLLVNDLHVFVCLQLMEEMGDKELEYNGQVSLEDEFSVSCGVDEGVAMEQTRLIVKKGL